VLAGWNRGVGIDAARNRPGQVSFSYRHYKLAVKLLTSIYTLSMHDTFPFLLCALAWPPLAPRPNSASAQSLPTECSWVRSYPRVCCPQADEGPNSRDRHLQRAAHLLCFLYQVLKPTAPAARLFAKSKRSSLSTTRAGSMKAIALTVRLASDCPSIHYSRAGGGAAAGEKNAQLWHGLRPKVIDSTTVGLPRYPQNQRAYPQSRSQNPVAAFP